jgi:type IV pilus assembly protein PilY1
LLSAGHARAQVDLDPPMPNVMLLVDSSGSMEYKVDGTGFPKCYPGATTPASEKSRWIDLVEVLTGSIPDYSCEPVNRSASSFLADYDTNKSDTGTPYDYLYPNPYHRPISGKCVAVPGNPPSNPFAFPDDAIKYREYNTTGTCSFVQNQDGILDAYASQIRFGLMTFDPLTDPATGVTGTTQSYAEGMKGGWTYRVGNTPKANPAYCLDPPVDFDAGARNPGAPPWEGRMVGFGDPATGSKEYETRRDQIEKVLLMTRPYGATPIAGMLKDAQDFFLNDESVDPITSKDFGPYRDPYVISSTVTAPSEDPDAGAPTTVQIRGCRHQSIVLLTDGRPNLDLRPFCLPKTAGGVCPYLTPEEIAEELVKLPNPIDTFVIPFALPTFKVGATVKSCNDLKDTDFFETDATTLCGDPANKNNEELQACCVLNRIAVRGSRPDKLSYYPDGKPRAFFVQDRDQLASALSSVLSSTINVTSRTQPVISGAAQGTTGMRFFSFVQPRPLKPWAGALRRQRWTCSTTFEPEPIKIDAAKGDDFNANLVAGKADRRFVTIEGKDNNSTIRSKYTLRPSYGAGTDGAGKSTGDRVIATTSTFASSVKPEAMDLTATSCAGTNATGCRDRYLKWLVGEPNQTPYTRCDAKSCELLGDALHSTPAVVGPPGALLRDETYTAYAKDKRFRPIVLYTSTNDGFLHAFRVGSTDPSADDTKKALTKTNNELWAFVPPAVLPDLPKQYPFNHQRLLDGSPVVKDVVATRAINLSSTLFERRQEDAVQGASGDSKATWRTILIQSFGPMRGGYFALDVTDPEITSTTDAAVGPRFLWQLTTDAEGKPLFGPHGSTPLITTLYFTPPGATTAREVAVAVLPGGRAAVGSSGTGAGCPQTPNLALDALEFSDSVKPRKAVRCYSGDDLKARSLTIVRLDTGEIVRTFRLSKSEVENADLRSRVTEVKIDSPISGQPVAFPAEVGAVADRVYVGDQDGRLWRVDLAKTDPADWKMELFFDAFPERIGGTTLHDFDDGQPIVAPPAVSVDQNGDITLNIATGDQETLGTAPGVTNYVWSVTEELNKDDRTSISRRVNWYKPFLNGERVVGSLTLFNSQVFFTTYTPAAGDAPVCKNGDTRVWGMDYLRPKGFGTAGVVINDGGDPRLRTATVTDPVQYLTAAAATGDPNAVVFGLSVAQQPTCSDSTQSETNSFLGYGGAQRAVRNVNPGRFELVMHKGGTNALAGDGSVSPNVATLPLPSPPTASRIDSWAALVE